MPTTAITMGDQEQAKGEFKYKKEIFNSYDVILMALKSTFERVIDKAYHTTGNTVIMGDGFRQLTPFKILQKLRKTYGRANIQEIESKLLQLNNPMDRNLPMEVMIWDMEVSRLSGQSWPPNIRQPLTSCPTNLRSSVKARPRRPPHGRMARVPNDPRKIHTSKRNQVELTRGCWKILCHNLLS